MSGTDGVLDQCEKVWSCAYVSSFRGKPFWLVTSSNSSSRHERTENQDGEGLERGSLLETGYVGT